MFKSTLFTIAVMGAVICGCRSDNVDVDLRISGEPSQVIFDFILSGYTNRPVAREVEATIEKVSVRNEKGQVLQSRAIKSVAIYQTFLGPPMVRLSLDKDRLRSCSKVTLSALVYLNGEYYILYGKSKNAEGHWEKEYLPSYGTTLFGVPRLFFYRPPGTDESEILQGNSDKGLVCDFRLYLTRKDGRTRWREFKRGEVVLLDDSGNVLWNAEPLLSWQGTTHKSDFFTGTLRCTLPFEKFKGKRELRLVLHCLLTTATYSFEWHISLTDDRRWVLTEEPDYGEVLLSAKPRGT